MEFDLNLYDPETNEGQEVSAKQLKFTLKEQFDKCRAVDGLKAKFRKHLLLKLMGKEEENASLNEGHSDLKTKVVQSAVFHYLKSHNFLSTVSVFAAETGLEESRALLTEMDINRMIKFNNLSNIYPMISQDNLMTENLPPMVANIINSGNLSVLDIIFEYCLTLRAELTTEIGIQATLTAPSARELLNTELFELEKRFSKTKFDLQNSRSKSIDERLLDLHKDYEFRKQQEIEIQMKYFKEQELNKMRLEETRKLRQKQELYQKELEFDYQQRLKYHTEREQEFRTKLKDNEQRYKQEEYVLRQQYEKALDDIKQQNIAQQRKQELEQQGLKLLECHLKELQGQLESRDRYQRIQEEEFQVKKQHFEEKIRQEIQNKYQKEWEEIQQEKAKLLLERRRFEESKMMLQSDVDSLQYLRSEIQTNKEQLALKNGEITSLQRTVQQQMQQLVALSQQHQQSDLHPNEVSDFDHLLLLYVYCFFSHIYLYRISQYKSYRFLVDHMMVVYYLSLKIVIYLKSIN
jgi:oral-facial-digital syndrome 1 protein